MVEYVRRIIFVPDCLSIYQPLCQLSRFGASAQRLSPFYPSHYRVNLALNNPTPAINTYNTANNASSHLITEHMVVQSAIVSDPLPESVISMPVFSNISNKPAINAPLAISFPARPNEPPNNRDMAFDARNKKME